MNSFALVVLASVIASSFGAVASSKSPRWEYDFQSPQAAVNPQVHNDLVIVPTNTTLHVLHVATGGFVWSFEYPNGDLGGYAAASDDFIVVGTLSSVYALSWNGTLIWTFSAPTGSRPTPFNHFRPSFGVGGIYVTTGYTPLIKISKSTGAIIWTAGASQGIAQLHATEALDGAFVYVVSAIGSTEYVVALNAANAQQQWNVSGVVTIIVSPALGVLFAQGGNATAGTITAYSLLGGALKYQLAYNGFPLVDYYLANTTLYVDKAATSSPYPTTILKYDGATGTPAWSVGDVNFLFFIPCSKGIVNFGSDYISAFDEATGALKWRYAATAVNDGAATSNNIIVAITAGKVIAFDF
ncbi:Hypothetical protein, putative [Bodo saltans]|uniref:Pyrrolo-quinoline quinone repeat domain-containing protein n=1 Tax=Bodo saltans TaxID=75058 RepID=A0A0S4JKN1_BODSA|nr:Hypothetical protein, putative [Bodo saltans]|eukprot:CUG90731.1 Hypothetical protein, putative [Bodo saltans]